MIARSPWFSMPAAFLVPPLERLPAGWMQRSGETLKRSDWHSAACELLLHHCHAESPSVKWSVVRFLTLHPPPHPPHTSYRLSFRHFPYFYQGSRLVVISTCLSLLAVWALLIAHSDTRLTCNGPYVWFMSRLCLETHAGMKTVSSSSSRSSLAGWYK